MNHTVHRVRKKGSFGKRVFSKSSFSRDSREFRDSRVSREFSDCGKERRFRPFSRDSRDSRDSREFRDSIDFSSEKTPLVMTPFSGPEFRQGKGAQGEFLVRAPSGGVGLFHVKWWGSVWYVP